MQLSILILSGLVLYTEAAGGVKGGYSPRESQQRPFYGTKGKPVPSDSGALPSFVSPSLAPPAPVPEPSGDDFSGPPMPYAFAYSAEGHDGRSSRQESSDGNKVTGSYTLEGPDGINRIVHYIADENGFRATVSTNEPGTESKNPSGVIMTSSQLPGDEIARLYGPQEPIRSPAQQYLGAPAAIRPVVAALAPLIDDFEEPIPVPLKEEPLAYAQPQILHSKPAPFAPSKTNFGFRSPSFRAPVKVHPVKGHVAPVPQRKLILAPPQIPQQSVKKPLVLRNFRAPVKAPPKPIVQFLAPIPAPPPPPVRGKTNFLRNPKPFFAPKTTVQPYFEDQHQQQEVFDETQEQQKHVEEPEVAQQQTYDEPQEVQQHFSAS